MSPFMKGAIGFLGCAGIVGTAYVIGKKVGREEALKEVEYEERKIAESTPKVVVVNDIPNPPKETETKKENEDIPVIQESQETAVDRVRNKKHGIKGKFMGGVNLVKDLLGGNADGKKLVVTMEDGDVVARLSQKGP